MKELQISFRDFIAISEGKNVGILFHFTRISSLITIIKHGFNLASHQDYISFTRNYDMINNKKYKNDLSNDIGNPRGCRIAIDGTKLSNKYKISPFLDIENYVSRNSGENEERIKKDIVNILDYIIQIDFLNADSYNLTNELELLKKHKIKYNFVQKFKKIKGT